MFQDLKNPLKAGGTWIILFFALLGVSAFGLLMITETHDSAYATDIDFFGRHACPLINNPLLQLKFAASPLRPDEDNLWHAQLKSVMEQEYSYLNIIQPEYRGVEKEKIDRTINRFKSLKNHYLVEVRRTILEIEAKHPLYITTQGNGLISSEPDSFLDYNNLFFSRGCLYRTDAPSHVHDLGRSDTVIWYLHHGIFPINASPPASTKVH